jgi:replicative DNA helicase
MIESVIELQVICRILESKDQYEVDRLCGYDDSYYSVLQDQIDFILDHREKFGTVPDPLTFQAQFEDFERVDVTESLEYLENGLKRNKQLILFRQTYNKLADLGSSDVSMAWEYLSQQCDKAANLGSNKPLDVVEDAEERAQKVIYYNNQSRIPTGFKEIDELMYGGLSTVEEFLLIVARTNSGKSWICTKMMESAQKAGYPVLFYSPEMQSCYIGARFDTWRDHFKNSDIFRGRYTDDYLSYLKKLSKEETQALVVEDADMSEGRTTVRGLEALVKRYHSKLLIIDGLSYIASTSKYSNESIRYRDICNDLFRLSKKYGCAVVVTVQANRESRENRDDNGQVFPDLYNISESDHPARIATQVFALRQLYESHMIQFRLEKSRNALNERPVLSYRVDFNEGKVEYAPDGTDSPEGEDFSTPNVSNAIVTNHISESETPQLEEYQSESVEDDDDYDDVEF